MVAISHFEGIQPRLAEHMLRAEQATIAHDVKLRNGRLEAWRTPCEFGLSPADNNTFTFHMHGCCLASWTKHTDVAELAPDWGRFYITDHCGGGLRYVDTDSCCNQSVYPCGVPVPTRPPVATDRKSVV